MTAPDPLVVALVARRRALGLSQRVVAGKIGVAREALSKIENGHAASPRLSLLMKYAGVVGATVDLDLRPPTLGDEADDLAALAAHLVKRGSAMIDEGIALRAKALTAMPVGTVLIWLLEPHRIREGDVARTPTGWVKVVDGGPVEDEWVAEQWGRGNLMRGAASADAAGRSVAS